MKTCVEYPRRYHDDNLFPILDKITPRVKENHENTMLACNRATLGKVCHGTRERFGISGAR